MKKILPYILIILIFANILAPLSVENNNVGIQKAEAVDPTPIPPDITNGVLAYCVNGKIKLCVNSLITSNDTSAKMSFYIVSEANLIEDTSINITVKGAGKIVSFPDASGGNKPEVKESKNTVATGSTSGYNTYFTNTLVVKGLDPETDYNVSFGVVKKSIPIGPMLLAFISYNPTLGATFDATGTTFPFRTTKAGSTGFNYSSSGVKGSSSPDVMPACAFIGFGAGSGTFTGCIAQLLYWTVFTPTSYLFALAGKFFDFTFFYSVSDNSYRTSFVVQGWGIMRDFCNMFFIFVLLYIAFSTILNIHGFKTKEMVINVIIVGILLNFSLFATQVIIDTSNILARVFYSSDTIKVTQTTSSGSNAASTLNTLGENGEIQLSAALVDKVNPQNLISNAGKVSDMGKVGNTDAAQNANDLQSINTGTFILVTLLASAVNIVGFVTFLTVGLIFVTRVIGLWFAMIFVPVAFFSYTVPALQDVDTIGIKKWWPETLKLAFLAPIFIFFLYLILKFMETGLGLMGATDPKITGVAWVVTIVVPFAFIMILLTKAKTVAVKFSGEMGAAVSKIGSAASGLVLGGMVGGGAALMRGTIGRAGSAVANSEWAKAAERKGIIGARGLRTFSTNLGKGSMDIRGTKIGGMASGGLGADLGKAKEGGFTKMRADKTKSRLERAEELKVGPDAQMTKDLRAKEVASENMKLANGHKLEEYETKLETARKEHADKVLAEKAETDPTKKEEKKKEVKVAFDKVEELKKQKDDLKNARGEHAYNTDNGKVSKEAVEQAGKEHTGAVGAFNAATTKAAAAAKALADAESKMSANMTPENGKAAQEAREAHKAAVAEVSSAEAFVNSTKATKDKMEKDAKENGTGNSMSGAEKAVKDAKHGIDQENRSRLNEYADHVSSGFNKFVNFFSSMGQHSSAGADEAAHKMRMAEKVSGGGHHKETTKKEPAAHPKPAAPEVKNDDHKPAEHH